MASNKGPAKPKEGENRGNAGKGRPKGSPNKTTALLKEAILAGAEAVGDAGEGGLEGYCKFLARDEPRAFAALLGKVLPMQLTGDPNNPAQIVFKTVYEQAQDERS